MAVAGDVVMLTLQGRIMEQLNENVFFYRIEDAPTALWYEGLDTEFVDTVVGALQPVTTSRLNWYNINIKNIFDAGETYDIVHDIDGTDVCTTAPTSTPSFLAMGVKLLRTNARVRHGYKYIGGLCEDSVEDNQIAVDPALLSAIEAALSAELVAGGVDTFAPVIVGRVRTTVPRPTELNPANLEYVYSLPTSQEQMGDIWSYVRDAKVNPDVTTMRSRKVGHGV